mmetsp:Transcript_32572/g.56396  ORF Transcript_32572/g.56396 Transcript_32572/m.56396 type:complete len:118 (-) Transcript_32572:1881-2234(-)
MAALKALKVKEIITSAFPRTGTIVKHFNKPFYLIRNDRTLEPNELIFRTKIDMTKPEMTQILTKLYGIEVKSLSSWNKMGKIKRSLKNNEYYRQPDFKKFSVKCEHTVPPRLQTIRE